MHYANKVDFTGQPLYIGMDVHKKSWTVSILMEHLEHKTFTQPPDVASLVSYLHHHFPGARMQPSTKPAFAASGFMTNSRHTGLHAGLPTRPTSRPGTRSGAARATEATAANSPAVSAAARSKGSMSHPGPRWKTAA